MKNLSIFVISLMFIQLNAQKSLINDQRIHQINQLVNKTNITSSSGQRDFSTYFDTLISYVSLKPDPYSLQSNLIVERDEQKRIISATYRAEDDDKYNFSNKYEYSGNENKFSKAFIFRLEGDEEIFEYTLINRYSPDGKLIFSSRTTENGVPFHTDSLAIGYNSLNQIESCILYTLRDQSWRQSGVVCNIKYENDEITEFIRRESFEDLSNLDSTEFYKYENTIFYENNYSYLIGDLVPHYIADSSHLELYFGDFNNVQSYIYAPISYNRYRLQNNNNPPELIDTKRFTITDHLNTIYESGNVIDSTNHYFNEDGKLYLVEFFKNSNLWQRDSIVYNDQGRTSRIYYDLNGTLYTQSYDYLVDTEGRLEEFTDSFDQPVNSYSIKKIFKIRGVADIEKKEIISLNIYPNPTSDIIELNFNNLNSSSQIITNITDISGNVVQTDIHKTNESKTFLNVKNLSPGMYQIMSSDGTKITTGKFVKI